MAAAQLIGSYNHSLVAFSLLIAIVSSYAALDLAGRVTASHGWIRVFWLLGGAVAMGTGIWSMHYIGMLAFMLPIPMANGSERTPTSKTENAPKIRCGRMSRTYG